MHLLTVLKPPQTQSLVIAPVGLVWIQGLNTHNSRNNPTLFPVWLWLIIGFACGFPVIRISPQRSNFQDILDNVDRLLFMWVTTLPSSLIDFFFFFCHFFFPSVHFAANPFLSFLSFFSWAYMYQSPFLWDGSCLVVLGTYWQKVEDLSNLRLSFSLPCFPCIV